MKMQTQADKIAKDYQIQVQECLRTLQHTIEDSYNSIDAKLDQLLNNSFSTSTKQPLPIHCILPVGPKNLFHTKDEDFPMSIFQEANSLINKKIEMEVQLQHKKYSQKNEIKQEQKMEEMNHENQQLKNEQKPLYLVQKNSKPFTYELMPEISIKQDEECCAIAGNQDFTILICGCNSKIKVFEFNIGRLKQVQILNEHEKTINTLKFMKISNQFISGSVDQSIIIWAQQNNSWICKQKLDGHTFGILCLAINTNEDVIVSGGADNKIKFWLKTNEWMHVQTISDHARRVLGLSFNDQQNRVISCGDDSLVLVIEQSKQNQQWLIIQKITIEEQGLRICFIDNQTFTLYPWGGNWIYVFEMNSTHKQYTKVKQIEVEGGWDWSQFPQQYVKISGILLNKNSENVSLIKRKEDGEFITQQSIRFGTYQIFGYLADDGQYLITWDNKSKEYQIRRYLEQ